MPFVVYMIAMMTMEVIAATIGLTFYYFMFWLIFQRKSGKPKELRADEHVYYPVRFYVPLSKILCEYIAFVIIMVSFQSWILNYWDKGKDFAVVGLACALIASFLPLEKKVKRVVVNAKGITLEYRVGGYAQYETKQYADCVGKCLYFEGPNGTRKKVQLRFLCGEDRNAVVQDLKLLKQTGKLMPETAVNVMEEWKKADQQYREEKQKLYADTKRYEAYLNEEAAKRLSKSQKQDLVRMIQLGDKMNAIKRCREWSGLGLKEAKDVVEQYRKCLMDKEEMDGILPVVTASENNADRLKSDAEIRELDKKYADEAEKWKALRENPKQYDAFLRQTGKQISENRRREIVQLAQNGEMVKAIKLFRDVTGQSLKTSHDLVMAYQTYLVADEPRGEKPGNKGDLSWKWSLTDKEQELSEQRSLEGTLDQLLSDLSMRREEFVALIPPAPLLGVACVRATLDPQGIMFRAEVEFVEHDAQGKPKILYKDGLMSWDVRDVFVAFRRSARVQTDGWQQKK